MLRARPSCRSTPCGSTSARACSAACAARTLASGNTMRTPSAASRAFVAEKVDVAVEEIDVEDTAAPTWARGWGSPTILVDGQDVAGQQPSESSACRLYAGGAPAVETNRASIATARGDGPGKARVAL